MNPARLRETGRFRHLPSQAATTATPDNTRALLEILDPSNRCAKPLRPSGACSSTTDCYTSSMGTSISTEDLNRILNIDHEQMTFSSRKGASR